MILSASAGSSSGQLRRKEKDLESDDNESEISVEESDFESELSDIEPSADYIDEKDVQVTSPQRKAIKELKNTWESFGLNHDEESIKGKWY